MEPDNRKCRSAAPTFARHATIEAKPTIRMTATADPAAVLAGGVSEPTLPPKPMAPPREAVTATSDSRS